MENISTINMENSIDKENFLDETPVQNTGEFSLDPDSPIYPFPQAKSTELISRKRPLASKDQNREQLTLGGQSSIGGYSLGDLELTGSNMTDILGSNSFKLEPNISFSTSGHLAVPPKNPEKTCENSPLSEKSNLNKENEVQEGHSFMMKTQSFVNRSRSFSDTAEYSVAEPSSSLHQSHLVNNLTEDKGRFNFNNSHKIKPNFAMLAQDGRCSSGSGEEKYIYGDFHAFRQNNSSLEEETPVRRATKQTFGKNLSLAWSTESSEPSSNKTQIERAIDSKYFQPAKPTNLTQDIEIMGLKSPAKVADRTFDQVIQSNQHDSFGFNDDDFLSDDAALKQLSEDEVAFENSNMFLLGDNDVNSEVASMIGNNDTNDISQFFNHGNYNNELGLEGTSSPEKIAFKKPIVPAELFGASETINLGPRDEADRRDTVSTIKSMPYSIFETTQGVENFHQNLKKCSEQDKSANSFSLRRMQDEHQLLKNKQFDDTLDLSVFDKHRFSLDTVTSDLLSEHPKSQSSPSRSDKSEDTTRNIDSIELSDSTQSNIEELCKTTCGFKAIHQMSHDPDETTEIADHKAADSRSEISSVSSCGSRMSKLQRRQSGSATFRAQMGRFNSLPSGIGQNVRFTGQNVRPQVPANPCFEPIRPYSPAPFVEFMSEIDFPVPVFIGDSATQMLPIHGSLSNGGPTSSYWLNLTLRFRTVQIDSDLLADRPNPFVIHQTEFRLAPGQNVSVPIHFRPKIAGRCMAILEIRVRQTNQYVQEHEMSAEQVHTINIIGGAISPKVKIGDGSGEVEIGHGQNKLPIQNCCNYDLQLLVDIDPQFSIFLNGEEFDQLLIPRSSEVIISVVPKMPGPKHAGKLKVYFNGKEKPILDWSLIKVRAPNVELSGPTDIINLRTSPHTVSTGQIPIFNCGKDMASINARIDGPLAELIQCSPETATIPSGGEVIFSLKYSAAAPRPRLDHHLILELHGLNNEFVCPFTVTTVDALKGSFCPSKSDARLKCPTDTILSNRSMLIWTNVEPGLTESKSVTLRGNGSYRVQIDGISQNNFQVFQNETEVTGKQRILLKTGRDVLITVKFRTSNKQQFMYSARVRFISDQNAKLKSTIPLMVVIGNPLLSLNGEKKKKKVSIVMQSGRGRLTLKNVGTCPAFAYVVPSKGSPTIDQNQRIHLEVDAEVAIEIRDGLKSASELTIYSGSAEFRSVMADILQRESGKKAWTAVLEKAKSSRLVKLDLNYAPYSKFAEVVQDSNHSQLVGAFLRGLSVDNVILEKGSKPTNQRPPSLDSVPTKESESAKSATAAELVIYPTELDLEKQNELRLSFPIGYVGAACEVCLNFDAKRMRVSPTRFSLSPTQPVTITVISLDRSSWEGSLTIGINGGVRLLRLRHKGKSSNLHRVPQLLMSENFIDFGMLEPRSSSERLLKLTNNDQIAYSWLLQSVDASSPAVFSISPREGSIESGEESTFTVKFNPRNPGVFEQEWSLEYHIKGLMGLAKTIKKIPVKVAGKSRVLRAIRANPSYIEFAKQSGDQRQTTVKVQLQNRTHEKVSVEISKPDEPFSIKRLHLEMKPRYYIDLPISLNYPSVRESKRYESRIEVKSDGGDVEVITLVADL